MGCAVSTPVLACLLPPSLSRNTAFITYTYTLLASEGKAYVYYTATDKDNPVSTRKSSASPTNCAFPDPDQL